MDINVLKRLYKEGFGDSDEYIDFFFKKFVKKKNIITHSENDKIISAGYIIEKPAVIFNKETVLPYLSALSTFEGFRGKGAIENVIREAFIKLYKRGHTYAALFPFDYNYYMRYSFTNISFCGASKIIGGETFKSRTAEAKDYKLIQSLYTEMVKTCDSYLLLNDSELALKIDEYAADSIDCLILTNNNDEDFAFAFIEDGLISFYGTNDMQSFILAENLKNLAFYDFTKNDCAFLQGRIINAQKALTEYPYAKNLNINLKIGIIDHEIIDNNITRQITVENGVIKLTKCTSADLTLDISELTMRMFCGDNLIFNTFKNCFTDKY